MHPIRAVQSLASLASLAVGCASGPPTEIEPGPESPPYVLVLGTAQDGGLPQIGCHQDCCTAARDSASRRRLVTSLLLVDPQANRRWLLDASPDIADQVEMARGHAEPTGEGRPALFDGILLTHAHMGHVAGLLPLGHEAYGSRDLPLFAAPGMASFLRNNDPYRFAIHSGIFRVEPIGFDEPRMFGESLSITAIRVPHRDEFSDTVAFRIDGPRRSLLYLPDIDKWDRWDRRIEDELARVDYALVDGTFFADGEIPGRAMADIPHPFIAESIERLRGLDPANRAKVYFTHLNHTNPAADPASDAARTVRAAGMHVATDGMILHL